MLAGVHALFAATLALAAFLLFWAELLVGRLLVPRLGGTPAVWATCLLFFQATPLLGYAAAGSDLAGLVADARWGALTPGPGAIWTDDHADVWGALRLR